MIHSFATAGQTSATENNGMLQFRRQRVNIGPRSGFDYTHQAHFTPDFVPGGAQNQPTRRTFGVFSYLVLSADSAKNL